MSVPHPLDNPVPSVGNTLPRGVDADTPIKPFRLPAKVDTTISHMRAIWASVYDDKKEVTRALTLAVIMLCIIAGSIVAKTPFTYASLAIFVVALIGFALSDAWSALLLFVGYLSLEGLYKYTSHFNNVVYAIAPVMGALIFVAWQISFRNRLLQKKKQKDQASEEDPKQNLFQNREKMQSVSLPALTPIVFALALLCVIQAFNPDAPGILSAFIGGVVWYIAPISLFFVTYYSMQRFKQAMGLTYTIICVSVVVSAYAIIQYKLGKDWCYSHIPGIDTTSNLAWFTEQAGKVERGSFRPVSTSPSAGGYAPLSAYGLFAGLAVVLLPKTIPYRRVLAFLGLSVMAIAIVVSGVRSTLMAALLAGAVVLSLNVKNIQDAFRVYIASAGVAMLLMIAFVVTDASSGGKFAKRYLPSIQDPISSYKKNRGVHFQNMVQSIAIRPLGVGIRRGPGTRKMNMDFYQKDMLPLNNRETQWNAAQSDLGIFGVLAMGIFFIEILRRGFFICRNLRNPNLRAVASFLYGTVLFTIVLTLAGPVIQGNSLFWIACGALLALPRIDAGEEKLVREKMSEAMVTAPAVVTA